jgi:hypothetical protein
MNKSRQNETLTPEISGNLTGKQSVFLSHLLTSKTIVDACKRAKIGRATYYQWLKDETFREALKTQRRALVDEAFDLLKDASIKAIENLIELTDERNPSIKRLACKDVIEFNLKVKEVQEIEERLDRIERQVNL